MSSKIEKLAKQILALTAAELVELKRRLGGDFGGGLGVREPRNPGPRPTLSADAEDRSVRGRTIP